MNATYASSKRTQVHTLCYQNQWMELEKALGVHMLTRLFH